MSTVIISGRVWPFSVDLDMAGTVTKTTFDEFLQKSVAVRLSIKKSRIEVTIEVDNLVPTDMGALFVRAIEITRIHLDLVSFHQAIALSAVFDFSSVNGQEEKFAIGRKRLAGLCTAYDPAQPNQIETVLLNEPSLALSLHDLIDSMGVPSNGIACCARSIEGLRHAMCPGVDRKKAWPILRDALNVDEPYIDLILKHSQPQRHGDRSQDISMDLFSNILTRGWILMNRYFEFRLGGATPLRPPTFPLLKG